MAKVLDYGRGPDTPFVPPAGAEGQVVLPLLNPKDLRVTSENGSEVILAEINAFVGQPGTLRTSQRKVANVFSGSDVDAPVGQPVKAGLTTYVELKETWSVTDDSDPSYVCLLPMRIGISVTIPTTGMISDLDLNDFVLRGVSALLNENVDGTLAAPRLANLQRGVIQLKGTD